MGSLHDPRQGVTLTEVLIASALAVIVVIGIGALDVTRTRMEEKLRQDSGVLSERGQVALAALQMSRHLGRADRIRILETGILGVNPTSGGIDHGIIQIRYADVAGCPQPVAPSCLDNAATYHWDQYSLGSGSLVHYEDTLVNGPPNCVGKVLAQQVGSLTFRYQDVAQTPPGGAPFAPDESDNNIVEYAVRWDNGLTTPDHQDLVFRGEVDPRAIAYSDVNAELTPAEGDSGSGVAPATPAFDPPAAPCP